MTLTLFQFAGTVAVAEEDSKTTISISLTRKDVGKATVGGFLFVLVLLIGVNLLSMGIMHRAKLAGLPDASMGDVLSSVVGPWGSVLVSAGVIISLLGALLAWILLCGETMQVADTFQFGR